MLSFIRQRRQQAAAARARAFSENQQNPWLISFPRTGSHWLRMMLELYTDRPLLPRSFFEHGGSDYLLVHTHDVDFSADRQRVIYLYRDPVPTVFSQIKFHQRDLFDLEEVTLWATIYRLHLRHWLERPHSNMTVVRYENLRSELVGAMTPVLEALDQPVDAQRLLQVAASVDRQKVQERTTHDPRVINREADYEQQRQQFAQRWTQQINQLVIEEGKLQRWFPPVAARKEAA